MTIESPMKAETEQHLQVHLAEYLALRDELIYHLSHLQQSLAFTFGLSAIGMPILLGQSELPKQFIVGILLLISIFISGVGLSFANALFSIKLLASYIQKDLAPRVNELLDGRSLLRWEDELSFRRKNLSFAYLHNIGAIGSVILMLLPNLIILLISYTLFTAAMDELELSNIIRNLLWWELIFACAFYLISTSTIIASTIATEYVLQSSRKSE